MFFAARDYGAEDADEAAGTEDASLEGVTISEIADDTSDEIEEIAELTAELADDASELAEDTSDDDGAGASLELTTALEGSTGVTGVGVPRLKIQMRPTITMTATMMMIQVLRFI